MENDYRLRSVVREGVPNADERKAVAQRGAEVGVSAAAHAGSVVGNAAAEYGAAAGERPATAAEVAAIVREALSELRVYVLEADITDAQAAVRATVEKSMF